LHRDLKPANVLIDLAGRAFVTDFGLAAHEGLAVKAAGTPAYMAPESLMGKSATTGADIWGLGAILYELLSGHTPFEGSPEEITRRANNESPAPLTGVPLDLAAVCQHCLEKDPIHRYATAGELAADLKHFLAGEPVSVRPRGRRERAFDFCARHPWIAALAPLLVVASVYGGIATLYAGFTAASRDRAEQTAFHAADFAARRAAEVTALQFDRYKAAVEAAGRDPRVVRAALHPDSGEPSEICAGLLAEQDAPSAGPFSHWFMFDRSGKMIGRSTPAESMGRVYAFRDYYQGAEALEKQGRHVAYVSRTYRSEGDNIFEISISFTIHDDAGHPIGLINGAISTGSVLGSIQFDDRDMAGLTAALIAPRDRERLPGVIDREPVFIMHSGLGLGHVVPARTREMLDADIASGGYMRVVPVRGTPFSVLVRVAFGGSPAPARPLQTSSP
jgi:hypothetical protein